MSADNWTFCPKCHREPDTVEAVAEKLYGTVPLGFYNEALAAARAAKAPAETLREDFEQGIREGQYYVSYRASCTNPGCGFRFQYKHEEPIK